MLVWEETPKPGFQVAHGFKCRSLPQPPRAAYRSLFARCAERAVIAHVIITVGTSPHFPSAINQFTALITACPFSVHLHWLGASHLAADHAVGTIIITTGGLLLLIIQ